MELDIPKEEECKLCNLRHFHLCGIYHYAHLIKNCPCINCLVKSMCKESCHVRYEYIIKHEHEVPNVTFIRRKNRGK